MKSESIQEQLIEYSTNYLNSCLPVLETMNDVALTSKQKTLISLGFDNCAELEEINHEILHNKRIFEENSKKEEEACKLRDWFRVLLRGRNLFGSDTLLIRFEDFFQLMKKNNLVCGTFSDYLGDIPDENLKEIEKLVNTNTMCLVDELRPIKEIECDDYLPEKIYRFPFVVSQGAYWFDILNKKTRLWFDGGAPSNYKVSTIGSSFRFFICAPEKKMKPLEKRITFRKVKDPFICSYNSRVNSVFIHSRWGEEAKSSTIRRYETLNKLILERIKDLNLKTEIESSISSVGGWGME